MAALPQSANQPEASSSPPSRRGRFFSPFLLSLIVTVVPFLVVLGLRLVHSRTEPFVDLDSYAEELPVGHEEGPSSLRFAVATMWSAESTFALYARLAEYVAGAVGKEESFVLRPSYATLRELMEKGDIDVAFICTGPYVCTLPSGSMRLLAVPVFDSGQKFRSIILVPHDSSVTGIEGLKGSKIAFSDHESFTGHFVPRSFFLDMGTTPEQYFSKTVFTGSHEDSILAVAEGLVDCAAVHSIVWHSMLRSDPTLKDRLREVWQSEAFAPPPVVISTDVDPELADQLARVFLDLHKDREMKKLLNQVCIERFVAPETVDYTSAIRLVERIREETGPGL